MIWCSTPTTAVERAGSIDEPRATAIDVALSVEHNQNLVYRFFTEGVTEGNLDIIDEVMDHDMMDHRLGFGNLSGTKGERELYSGAFPKAFPDGRADKIALIAEGDDVFW